MYTYDLLAEDVQVLKFSERSVSTQLFLEDDECLATELLARMHSHLDDLTIR